MPTDTPEIIIPEIVKKYAPWSYSMASSAIACPAGFYRRYTQKEKPTDFDAFDASLGKAVHRVLELTCNGNSTGSAYLQTFDEMPLTQNIKDNAKTYHEAVDDFMSGLKEYEINVGIKNILTEYQFGLTPDFKLTGYYDKAALFRGVIDLIIFTQDNRATIIDHKTGVIRPMDQHATQLNSYAILVDCMYPTLDEIRTGIHYVGQEKNASGKRTQWAPQYVPSAVRTKLRGELVAYLTKAAEHAEQGEVYTPCWKCQYCDYRSVCSHKK